MVLVSTLANRETPDLIEKAIDHLKICQSDEFHEEDRY